MPGAVEQSLADGAGNTRTVTACFVIGADGGSSAVRRSLGLRLEGGSAALSNISIMFRSKDLGSATTLPPAVQYWVVGTEAAGMVGRMDLADTWWAIIQGVDSTAAEGAANMDSSSADGAVAMAGRSRRLSTSGFRARCWSSSWTTTPVCSSATTNPRRFTCTR